MKFLITGDWHLRLNKPILRKDENYLDTQIDKVNQILELSTKNRCDYILQPGDFFDSFDTPFLVINKFIKILNKSSKSLIAVSGQHDKKNHTKELGKTSLGIMDACDSIKILKNDNTFIKNNVTFYGASWGEEIPKIVTPDNFNVLLTHRMIIKDKKLWDQQKQYNVASALLQKHEYDLIISGDNHQTFTQEKKGKILVNCGSLLRTRIDQEDHKPCVFLFDTTTKELEQIFLKVKPASEVFDLYRKKKEKERNEKLESLIKGLEETDIESLDLDFVSVLYNVIENTDCGTSIKIIADEFLHEYFES